MPPAGTSEVRIGVPANTVNPLPRMTTSDPVVTVTVRGPESALAAICSWTVRHVGHVTVIALTVIPALKSTVVVP